MECEQTNSIYSGPPLEDYEIYLSPSPGAGALSHVALFFRRLGHWLASFGEWNSDAKLVDHLASYIQSTRYVDCEKVTKIHAAFLERIAQDVQSQEAVNVQLQFIAQKILKPAEAIKPTLSYQSLEGRFSPRLPSPRSGILTFIASVLLGNDTKAIASPFPLLLWGVANQNSFCFEGEDIPYVAPVEICNNKENGIHAEYVEIDQTKVEETLRKIKCSKEKLLQLQDQSIAQLQQRNIESGMLDRLKSQLREAISRVINGLDEFEAKLKRIDPKTSILSIANYRELTHDYSKPYKGLLACLNSIEKELGIHNVMRSHLQNTILLMTKHDPQWQTLAPQTSIPDPSPELLAQHIDICRKYFSDRNPQVHLSSGEDGNGSEEDWFDKFLHILFPSYDSETWPLDCTSKLMDFSWESPFNGDSSRFDAGMPRLKQAKDTPSVVLGFSYTYQGHVTAFVRGDPNKGFAYINNTEGHCRYLNGKALKSEFFDKRLPSQPELALTPEEEAKEKSVSLSPRTPRLGDAILEGGVDYEGSGLALKLSRSASTPILQFPEPDRWVIPKWEKNNCFLVAALLRLATFQFYYLQPSIQEQIPRN